MLRNYSDTMRCCCHSAFFCLKLTPTVCMEWNAINSQVNRCQRTSLNLWSHLTTGTLLMMNIVWPDTWSTQQIKQCQNVAFIYALFDAVILSLCCLLLTAEKDEEDKRLVLLGKLLPQWGQCIFSQSCPKIILVSLLNCFQNSGYKRTLVTTIPWLNKTYTGPKIWTVTPDSRVDLHTALVFWLHSTTKALLVKLEICFTAAKLGSDAPHWHHWNSSKWRPCFIGPNKLLLNTPQKTAATVQLAHMVRSVGIWTRTQFL